MHHLFVTQLTVVKLAVVKLISEGKRPYPSVFSSFVGRNNPDSKIPKLQAGLINRNRIVPLDSEAPTPVERE